ncbi:hypothetical protein Tco_1302134 [Tanacetum coccineum]
MSSKEATKGWSSKAPTGSKTGHLKRKKESSLAMDSNISHTSASTLVVAEMHKEDQQATGGPTSLGVTRKGASSIARQVEEDEASRTIKLEDLEKLVSSIQPSFKDPDSPKDDPIIVVDDSDEDEEANEVHATTNIETEDTSVPKSSSPRIEKAKKFDFVTEYGKHIHLTEEQINQQKKIEEEAKVEASNHESEVRKEELVDLLGPEVVNKYYNDKLQFDKC